MTEAQQGGTRLPTAIEEATSMTATASTATSPEGLLGRVAEAMTGEVVVLAFKVYRYVAGGVLDEEHVTLAFTTAALAIGLDRVEISRTLASARTAGLASPRTVPAGPVLSIREDGS
jgi:hypothetical protein